MQLPSKWTRLILVLIPVISLAMHYRVIQLDLIGIHVWRQTQTQTVINNFAFEDFNILHPKLNTEPDTDRIMRLEFPLMQWVFALFFRIFGPHIIISRLLTFIIGIFSVFGIFRLLKNIFGNETIAIIGAWSFNFSPEFYYYTVNPLPDNLALCCSIWSAAYFFKWANDKKLTTLLFCFLFLTIAALVKLPFILYASLPVTWVAFNLYRKKRPALRQSITVLVLLLIILTPAFVWYITVIPTWKGIGIVKGISDTKLTFSDVVNILQANLISTLPELLINYGSVLFFVAAFWFIVKKKLFQKPEFHLFSIWGTAILCYFFFELEIISTVHDYYLFPFLPLIFILVAYGAYNLGISRSKMGRYTVFLLLLLLPLTAYLRTLSRWNPSNPGLNIDLYNNKNGLRQLVKDTDYCVVGNDPSEVIFLYYINKKGWTFDNDNLTAEQLKNWNKKGAKYLFTDGRVDTITGIKEQLGEKIFDKNTLRVFRLKDNISNR